MIEVVLVVVGGAGGVDSAHGGGWGGDSVRAENVSDTNDGCGGRYGVRKNFKPLLLFVDNFFMFWIVYNMEKKKIVIIQKLKMFQKCYNLDFLCSTES